MKLLFSEAQSDYGRYLFPYVIYAVPEAGEAPADLFNAGFLPSARGLGQFYLCRNVRVDLAKFKPSSENRRILEFYGNYAAARYGKGVMPQERLELTFNSPVATHLLVFTDAQSGAELGVVVLYLEAPRVAFYRYSFYDLNRFNRSLGLFLMTSAAVYFAQEKFTHLYLGTCYSERAFYKTQFAGVEFFNGFRWSQNLDELKFQLRREKEKTGNHLLENAEFREMFYPGELEKISDASSFKVQLSAR